MQNENSVALKNLLVALGFPKPPSTITCQQMFAKIELKLNELLKNPQLQAHLGSPLLTTKGLTNKQWNSIKTIITVLNDDFKSRVDMLLKRLDVTVQSFKWAERLKSKNDELTKLFLEKRKNLISKPNIDLSDLLAARDGKCLFFYFRVFR